MPLIFGLNVDYFLKDNVLMRKSPEVAGFLKYNLEEETYPSLPPFLFPNRTFDITQAFRTDHLVKACVLGLRLYASVLKASRYRHLAPFCTARPGPWVTMAARRRQTASSGT